MRDGDGLLMRCRRRRVSRGQVIITVAVSFALFVLGVIALVANLAVVYGTDAVASSAAQDAAIAGSADINVPLFLTGPPIINGHGPLQLRNPGADGVCTSVIDQEMAAAKITNFTRTCKVIGPGQKEITASVTIDVALPIQILTGTVKVTRTYNAAAVAGTTVPIT